MSMASKWCYRGRRRKGGVIPSLDDPANVMDHLEWMTLVHTAA